MDYGHEKAESILSDMELEIKDIYSQASNSAQKKAETYFEKFKAKDAVLSEQVKKGEMTEDDYKKWRINKLTTGARYKALEEGLASDLTGADKLAASVINGHLPDVYATNYNWGTYEIETNARIDTNFMIYDRQTVERLLRDKPDLLPMKAAVSVPDDMRWNKKNINNAITQGILLGDSIPDMAKRLAAITDMNRKSAVRNARTMTTSAENGGRVDSYKRAIDMGINITQKWLATKDNRTRHEHAMLDGQEVEVGKPFKVEGYEIMFPADPTAEPFLVYNCRCTLVSKFKGFDHKKMDEYTEQNPMSYKEWEEKHKKAQKPEKPKAVAVKGDNQKATKKPKTKEGWAYKTANSYYGMKKEAVEAINGYVENAPEIARRLWEKNAPKLQPHITESPTSTKKAYFSHSDKKVHFDSDTVVNGDILHVPYQNHFHEYMHNIDYLNRKDGNEMFTDGWRDKNGDKFEDIIMKEWRSKFSKKISDEEVAKKIFKELVTEGASPSGFVEKELRYWKMREKLEDNDERYIKLKEKYDSLKNSTEIYNFYKEHTAEFLTRYEREHYGTEIDTYAVKTYINDITKKYSLKDRGNLSDMMERFTVQELGLTRPMGAGHGKDYALRKGALGREAFAEIADSSFVNPTALNLIKQELPQTYKAWETMIEEMLEGGKKK